MLNAKQIKMIDPIAEWLLIFGGINLGLSIFNVDLIVMIADATVPIVKTIVLSAVGIAAVFKIAKIAKLF